MPTETTRGTGLAARWGRSLWTYYISTYASCRAQTIIETTANTCSR